MHCAARFHINVKFYFRINMSYVVVEFDDDGKICVVPASWVNGDNVLVPPMTGRNLRIAIMQAIPPNETWDEHPATCVLRAGKS